MIKVLVLEDKPAILSNIRQKLHNYSENIQIIGTAFNGIEGLSIIETTVPDIIITDIRMPIMDGLSFIKSIHKKCISPKIIILSGHDEFEYAREAMKLGVNEYLLKPLIQDELNTILDKLIYEIQQENEITQKDVIYNLINYPHDFGDTTHLFEKYESYYSLLICAGSYTYETLNYAHPHNLFISDTGLANAVMSFLPNGVDFMAFQGGKLNEMLGVFLLENHNMLDINMVTAQVQDVLSSLCIPLTIVTSNELTFVNMIPASLYHANILLRKGLIYGYSRIITKQEIPESNIQTDKIKSFIGQIILDFRTSRLSDLVKHTYGYLDYCKNQKCSQELIERQLKQVVSELLSKEAHINVNDYLIAVEELMVYNSNYEDLSINLVFFMRQVHEILNQKTIKPIENIVASVKAYISANYSKQISINDIALMFNVDACYLSKSFKQINEISPMNYLTEIRIKEAKHLLVNNPLMKLKDIAEIVGYSSSYYFSRIFKSVTNTTPSDFRSNYDKE